MYDPWWPWNLTSENWHWMLTTPTKYHVRTPMWRIWSWTTLMTLNLTSKKLVSDVDSIIINAMYTDHLAERAYPLVIIIINLTGSFLGAPATNFSWFWNCNFWLFISSCCLESLCNNSSSWEMFQEINQYVINTWRFRIKVLCVIQLSIITASTGSRL